MSTAEAAIQCTVVSPEKALVDERVDFVALPAYDGELGVMPGRAPLLSLLGHGELRITGGGQVRRFYVEGGFVQIRNNQVTVLTDTAIPVDELDTAAVDTLLAEAKALATPDADADAKKFAALSQAYAQKRLLARDE